MESALPSMNPQDRVLAAFDFRQPDRIPRFDNFWHCPDAWRQRFGALEELSDLCIWLPNEGAFPTRARELSRDEDSLIRVDSWGRTIRTKRDSFFSEILESPLAETVDPDHIAFDPPDLDMRYLYAKTEALTREKLAAAKRQYCVFGKTGGPYLRTTFVRGEEQFLMDIAGDPSFARALAERMADHLIGIAREEIRRWSLQETGVWIYDDMGSNAGPMFSPKAFEQVFLPAYRRMIRAYKEAGAKYVVLHSDGNIMPILDMLVDAGIDGLNPIERRAHMNPAEIRRRHPRLVLIGGMCNADTLINGPVERIQAEARELIDLGRHGGLIIGTHSISPEVPIEFYAAYHETCLIYGHFR